MPDASGKLRDVMNIRSMTGYAQVKHHVSDKLTVSLSLKSVNHRFLDLHLRIPGELDGVEMKVRRVLKERLHRGHIEMTLGIERAGGAAFAVNRELVGGYLRAFREAAEEFAGSAERGGVGRRQRRVGNARNRCVRAGHRAAEPHARGGRPRCGGGAARAHAASVEGDAGSGVAAAQSAEGISR